MTKAKEETKAPTMDERARAKLEKTETSLAVFQQRIGQLEAELERARTQVLAHLGAIEVLKDVIADDAISMEQLGEMLGGEVEYVPGTPAKG